MNWIYESVNHRGSGPGEIIITMTWLLRSCCLQQNIQIFTPADTDISMRLRSGMCIAISRHFGDIQRMWRGLVTCCWYHLNLNSPTLLRMDTLWHSFKVLFESAWLVLSLFAIIVPAYYKLVVATSFHRYIKWSILVPNKTVCHGCK